MKTHAAAAVTVHEKKRNNDSIIMTGTLLLPKIVGLLLHIIIMGVEDQFVLLVGHINSTTAIMIIIYHRK